jgi:hypothetical protein
MRTATKITFILPADAPAITLWRAGLYSVSVIVTKDAKEHSSNELPLILAPRINTISPVNPIARVGSTASLTITCIPQVIKEQTVSLLLPDREIMVNPRSNDTDPLDFVITDAQPASNLPVRLRVDGIDSMAFERRYDANGNPLPLAYADNQKVTIT